MKKEWMNATELLTEALKRRSICRSERGFYYLQRRQYQSGCLENTEALKPYRYSSLLATVVYADGGTR